MRSPIQSQQRSGILLTSALLIYAFTIPSLRAQDLRDTITAAHLGSGYAQLLNLTSSRDIGATHLDINGNETPASIDAFRLPYESRWLKLTDSSDLYWRVAANALRLRSDLDLGIDLYNPDDGTIASKWSAYSISVGLLVKTDLGNGFSLEPAIDAGFARLLNSADYNGTAELLKPLDGQLFNWNTNAWLVTPNLALAWTEKNSSGQKISVRTHASWSWINSFNESNNVLKFNETAGTYSVSVDYTAPTSVSIFQRSVDYVLKISYGGFFGSNRDALEFSSITEASAGFEIPLSMETQGSRRLRFATSYAYGSDVHGWSVGAGLRY